MSLWRFWRDRHHEGPHIVYAGAGGALMKSTFETREEADAAIKGLLARRRAIEGPAS